MHETPTSANTPVANINSTMFNDLSIAYLIPPPSCLGCNNLSDHNLKKMQSGAKSDICCSRDACVDSKHSQSGDECGCHCDASSPYGGVGGVKLHEVSSGPLLDVLCRHLYGFWQLYFPCWPPADYESIKM